MEYTELAEAYIQWNRALVKRFFPENAEDNVRIFVTPNVLDDIGYENKLGNHTDFIKTMSVSSEDRCGIYKYVCAKLCVKPNTLRIDNNIWNCALVYANTGGLANKLPDPYFNYLIFLMYIAYDGLFNHSERSLGEYIKDQTEKTIGKTKKRSNYSDIGKLFDILASQHPEFKNTKLTQQEYIGRIRYQLGLTDGQRTILERALYNCEERLDGMTFKEQCYYLRDYIDDETLLKQLEDDSWELTLSELIDNFDSEEYEENISDRKNNVSYRQETRRGELFLALDEDDKLVLLTKTTDRDIEITEGDITFSIYSCLDSYGEYNSNPVQIKKEDSILNVELKEYRFKGFKPLPFSKDNIIIFQELHDSPYLVQTRILSPNLSTYVLVKKLKKGEKDKYINQWENSSCYVDNKFVTDKELSSWAEKIFGAEWVCYYTEMPESCPQYFSIPTPDRTIEKVKYGFAGGVRLGNGYLFTAIPYLKLPSPINRSLLSECKLALRNKNGETSYLTEERDYKLIFGDQNLVFDLLIKRQEQDKYSVPLIISVKYANEIYVKELNVKWLPLVFHHEDLHAFDSWGQLVENEESAFLKGNTLLTKTKKPKIESVYQLSHSKLNESLTNCRSRFYFSALLAARCLTSPDYSITRCKLEKCIRYACTRFDLPFPDQKSTNAFIKKISSAGVINIVHKRNSTRYQFIPPALVEVPQIVSQIRLMSLIGSYTYGFLDDFDTFCESNNILRHYESPQELEGLDQLLPPIVLVGRDRMLKHLDIFTKETKHQLVAIPGIDYPLALLQGSNGLMEFKDTLSKVDPIGERWLKPVKYQHYPQVRSLNNTIAGNSKQYLQDKDLVAFYESSINDSDYLWAYAAYLRKEPMLRVKNRNAKIVLAFRRNSLSYLLEKAVFLMGFEHLHEGKIFVVNSKNTACPLFERADIAEIYDKNDTVPRVKELYNKLYPGYEHGSWEFLHKFNGREPIVSMKLYQIGNNKRRWINQPKYILHCLIEYKFKMSGFSYNETLNVCATSSKLWLKEGDTVYHWDGLKGSVNSIISALLSSNTQFKDLGLVQCDANQYPDLDLYEYHEELIVMNESVKS